MITIFATTTVFDPHVVPCILLFRFADSGHICLHGTLRIAFVVRNLHLDKGESMLTRIALLRLSVTSNVHIFLLIAAKPNYIDSYGGATRTS